MHMCMIHHHALQQDEDGSLLNSDMPSFHMGDGALLNASLAASGSAVHTETPDGVGNTASVMSFKLLARVLFMR